MFLTRLTLDSRHADVRRDLASAYEMHRTLTRAFVEDHQDVAPRFLWRLEKWDSSQGIAVVLLQSERAGRWQGLPAAYLLEQAEKQLDPVRLIQAERRYRFRLLANPTVTREGKRYGLSKEQEQLAWLERQVSKAGGALQSIMLSRNERWTLRKKGHLITVQAVGFEGSLTVHQADLMRATLLQGIGHAKSLGLGLLSLAPLDNG